MKRILVTGGTGFIGNHIIEKLLTRGHHITVTSSHAGRAETMPWFDKVTYIPFQFEQIDHSENYFEYFGKPDLLIHLAWAGLPNYKSNIHFEVNLPVQFAFLENLAVNGLKDITVTGTCFEYGMQEGELKESMPANPQNPYGIAKNELRIKLDLLKQVYGFNLKWVRLFYMFGPGQNPNSLLSQLEDALSAGAQVFNMSGGEQVRDFLPVGQVASHIVDIALQDKVQGIINCCSGRPIRVRDFVKNYLRTTNRSISLNLGHYPYPDYEPMRFWGNTEKLNKIINHD